jgi:hypothetical protein
LSQLAVLAKRIVGRENIAMGKMFARMVKFAKISGLFFYPNFNVIAPCGSSFDCRSIPGRHACRPGDNGEWSCKKVKPKQCLCADDEYCNMEDECKKPGNRFL